jgi:hypothetical protein
VGATEVADDLPGRRVHPPALQKGEEDDHGYGDQDPTMTMVIRNSVRVNPHSSSLGSSFDKYTIR